VCVCVCACTLLSTQKSRSVFIVCRHFFPNVSPPRQKAIAPAHALQRQPRGSSDRAHPPIGRPRTTLWPVDSYSRYPSENKKIKSVKYFYFYLFLTFLSSLRPSSMHAHALYVLTFRVRSKS